MSPQSKFSDAVFGYEDVILDGNEFTRCQFRNSRLIFRGEALPTFHECVIGNDVQFVFSGAALVTVQLLSMLAHRSGHGGLETVQSFIHDLYGGKFEEK